MRAKYTLKDGVIVEIFLWNDMLNEENSFIRKNVTIRQINPALKKEIHLDIFIDETLNKKYFVYKGNKKYFDDFDYFEYDELLSKIKKGEDVFESDILATFLKNPEKIAFVDNASISTSGNNNNFVRTIMIPFEKRYQKKDWSYKIELQFIDEETRNVFIGNTYYFSDLYSIIKSGNIKLVNREKIISQINEIKDNYNNLVIKEYHNLIFGIIGIIKRKIKKYPFEKKIIRVNHMELKEGIIFRYFKNYIFLKMPNEDFFFPI